MASLKELLEDEFDKDDGPDYSALAKQLGSDALPVLKDFVAGNDPRMASQAAYLAGVIAESSSPEVVELASTSSEDIVKAAAGFALSELPAAETMAIANRLLSDPDAGIRAQAVRFAAQAGVEGLARRVQSIADDDPEVAVRELAAQLIGESSSSSQT
jgi:HEAT repeat protein